MDSGDSGAGAQLETPGLCEKLQKARHVPVSFGGASRGGRLGAAAWGLLVRDETGSFERVSHGGPLLWDMSAMAAEREALRMDNERLTGFRQKLACLILRLNIQVEQ